MGEISDAFLEGMQEIYSIMFTSNISLSLLNEESTFKNIYNESKDKKYLSSITLVGKVSNTLNENELPVEEVKFDYVFEIPTKELIDHNIPFTPQDYDTLKKAKIVFQGIDYTINYIQPVTLIDEVFMRYKFFCVKEPKKSGGVY